MPGALTTEPVKAMYRELEGWAPPLSGQGLADRARPNYNGLTDLEPARHRLAAALRRLTGLDGGRFSVTGHVSASGSACSDSGTSSRSKIRAPMTFREWE